MVSPRPRPQPSAASGRSASAPPHSTGFDKDSINFLKWLDLLVSSPTWTNPRLGLGPAPQANQRERAAELHDKQ